MKYLWLVLLLLVGCAPSYAQSPSPLAVPDAIMVDAAPQAVRVPHMPALPPRTYLPEVHTAPRHRIDACGMNAAARRMAELFVSHPDQMRTNPVCDARLAMVAQAKAEDMARRGYSTHTDPDGFGPNFHVIATGYRLPDYYDHSPAGNNIESIAGGFGSPDAMWVALLLSPSHRAHLLGTDPFFAEQTDYGMGYYSDPSSRYRHYYVIETAREK